MRWAAGETEEFTGGRKIKFWLPVFAAVRKRNDSSWVKCYNNFVNMRIVVLGNISKQKYGSTKIREGLDNYEGTCI